MDGRSLVPLLLGDVREGESNEASTSAYGESVNRMTYRFTPNLRDEKDDLLFYMVEGRWKYVLHLMRPKESELYDLKADPGETRNLIGENPEVVKRMESLLRARKFLPRNQLQPQGTSPERAEALRALGYSGK